MNRLLMTVDAVGGVWRYAMDLGVAACATGWEVSFAGLGPKPTAAQADEARAIGTLDWGTAALDWMAHSPAELLALPDWILRVARSRRTDVLHLNLPSQAVGLGCRMPIIVVNHSCLGTWYAAMQGEAPPADMRWTVEITRRGLAAADVVVAPSASHAEAISQVYGPGTVRVVANSSRSPLRDWSPGAGVVAAARWWDRGKNGRTLDVAAGRTGVPVRMIGALEGPEGSRFRADHAEAGGPLPYPQTIKAIATATVFVSPSVYEPFGLAALEAARASRPLLLADIPTYRELWDGAAAFFAPHDSAALAQEIDALVADSARRRTLGMAARERAARFSPETQGAAMAEIWRSALTMPSRRTEDA